MVLAQFLCQNLLKKYDELDSTLKKLGSLKVKSSITMPVWVGVYYIAKLYYYYCIGDFGKGIELIPLLKKKFEKYQAEIFLATTLPVKYAVAMLYSTVGNYKEAAKELIPLLHHPQIGTNPDLDCSARLLNLLVQYELGYEDQLEHNIRSTYRYIYKKKRLYKFESVILRFFKTLLPKTYDQHSLLIAFTKLKNELINIQKDPFEWSAFLDFDFIAWLQSKIEKRSFAKVILERRLYKVTK